MKNYIQIDAGDINGLSDLGEFKVLNLEGAPSLLLSGEALEKLKELLGSAEEKPEFDESMLQGEELIIYRLGNIGYCRDCALVRVINSGSSGQWCERCGSQNLITYRNPRS